VQNVFSSNQIEIIEPFLAAKAAYSQSFSMPFITNKAINFS